MSRRSSKHPLPRAPRSTRAPFVRGESWDERHARRKTTAEADRDRLLAWTAARGGEVALRNDGAHWHIRVFGSLIQWWPESGRVVRDALWRAPGKAHDVDQVIELVERWRKQGKIGKVGAPAGGQSHRRPGESPSR